MVYLKVQSVGIEFNMEITVEWDTMSTINSHRIQEKVSYKQEHLQKALLFCFLLMKLGAKNH